eukprot:SAG11_NODE_3471_length_2429_cov_2.745494_1_plen_269_part_00
MQQPLPAWATPSALPERTVMDGLNSIQPGAFAFDRCGCGASCVNGQLCPATGEPEPEPEQTAPAPKRGMLTRKEAEEMAEKTSEDIAAAKAADALERERELAAEAARAQVDAAALSSPLEALDAFAAEQRRRVAAYRELAEALRVLLERGDLFKYQKTCGRITAEFASCSRRIMAISTNLRSRLVGGTAAANIIDAVQSHEEKKLHLTVALQVHAENFHARYSTIHCLLITWLRTDKPGHSYTRLKRRRRCWTFFIHKMTVAKVAATQ